MTVIKARELRPGDYLYLLHTDGVTVDDEFRVIDVYPNVLGQIVIWAFEDDGPPIVLDPNLDVTINDRRNP